MAIAEDLAIIHDPNVDDPFTVEQHGIDFIPESERWARPKDIFGMWAGASVQTEYFLYGAILMTFGFTFAQAALADHHRQPVLLPARAVLPAGAGRRDGGLRHQPGRLRAQRVTADLVLQLGHPDRVRGRRPHPHRRGRPRTHGQGRFRPRRPGQGDPRHRGGAGPGDPPLPRARHHRQDAAPADRPLHRALRRAARLLHRARPPQRRGPRRRLADLHGRAGLHHRVERARLGRVRKRLHPLLPDRRLEEGPGRLGLPRHGRPRNPHHDPGRRGGDVRGRHRDRAPAACSPSPTRASSRPGSSSSSWSSPWCSCSPSTAWTCTPRG